MTQDKMIALMFAVVEAGRRLSDKRTLMDEGYWVSKREMRYLDNALADFDESLPTAADVFGILNTDRSKACPLDPLCYRYQGHAGEHMHGTPTP